MTKSFVEIEAQTPYFSTKITYIVILLLSESIRGEKFNIVQQKAENSVEFVVRK